MQWTGEGLIIGARRHGETSVIAEVMVAGRGRCLGLVRGGRSRRYAAALQPGNSVQLTWRARLEDHLGTFVLEVTASRAAGLVTDRIRLYAAQLLCDHLRLLPERDPHDRLLALALEMIDTSEDAQSLAIGLARFELTLLEELGFGLDLETCAVTGATRDLTHVSPKTGRAVSRAAAEPYKDRLFRLPPFLVADAPATQADLAEAFAITAHFLDMHVWALRPTDPPSTRPSLVVLLTSIEG